MNAPSRSVAWEQIVPLATLLVVSLIAAGPLWGPGLLNTRGGGDSPFLLLRTHQLAANLRAGVFPVRWMPDAAYGFGYPFFSYYAALPYYVAAGFTLTGLDILAAIKLTQTLFFAAAAVVMYGWALSVLRSRPGAWLAAVAYSSAPFHLVNVYVRGDSLSEFAAFAFYPIILWGLDRLASRPSARRALLPALAYAGLIVTHNVSALLFSPFILLYVGLLLVRGASAGSRISSATIPALCFWLVASLLIALLLSAWFWLPALAETKYVQLDVQTTGYFFYGNHFRGRDLVQWKLPFDYAIAPDETSPFAMGLAQAILTVVGILVVIIRWARSQPLAGDTRREAHCALPGTGTASAGTLQMAFSVLGLLLSTWLITPLSRPLWDNLPLLPLAQFPWRFLSLQALFSGLFAGAVVSPLTRRSRSALSWFGAIALGALLVTVSLAGLRPEYLPITADDVAAKRLQLYELFTGNIGSTIRHEYLPKWVRPRPYTGPGLLTPGDPPRAIAISGELRSARRLQRGPTRRVWRVEVEGAGSVIALPLYYWPGWRATVDGTPTDVEPATGSGYLSVSVPAGTHTLEIWLGRTAFRLVAEVVSLAAVITAGAVWTKDWGRPTRVREPVGDSGPNGGRERLAPRFLATEIATATLPYVVLVVLLLTFSPRVTVTNSRALTMDFERMPYLHHNPGGVTSNAWRMVGYTFSGEHFAAGETVRVNIDWESTEAPPIHTASDAPDELRLVSPAAVRQEAVSPIAQGAIELDAQEGAASNMTTALELTVPRGTASGIYLPELATAPPIYLRPVWVTGEEEAVGRPSRATFAKGKVRLHTLDISQAAPGQLNVGFEWSASDPIAANYGLSLSLTDAAGNEWLRQSDRSGYDMQPGSGFLPTSLWPVDRILADRHTLLLPPGTPPSDSYTFTVDLYVVATWETVGEHSSTVSLNQASKRPEASIVARLGEELALSQLDVPAVVRQGDRLRLVAYWLTVIKPTDNYKAEWRLDGVSQSITSTLPLAPGSSPTEWLETTFVAGLASLAVPPTMPAGEYTVSLTLRDAADEVTLGTYTHPEPVHIQERSRIWELPALDERVGARFGDMIELAGYDLTRAEGNLHLALHWQAITTPDRHYTFFVHLADPATGVPVVQVDSMPRGFTYPTGLWAPGEVVSDDVVLPLDDIPSGHYDLAVGWYDPHTEERLQAVDNAGRSVPDNRLLLPDRITLP
ncbi:MAG: 6-pyruvoyl-tetrahydropterin synthase-related protein [Anaerolineae bacterium]|jgi:hypothetical protein